MMVAQCLVDGSQDDFSDLLATVQVMVTIGQDFRLNNWDNALRLADGSITSQNVGIFQDGLVAWGVLANFQDATPLGEVTSILLVLSATGGQVVET